MLIIYPLGIIFLGKANSNIYPGVPGLDYKICNLVFSFRIGIVPGNPRIFKDFRSFYRKCVTTIFQ